MAKKRFIFSVVIISAAALTIAGCRKQMDNTVPKERSCEEIAELYRDIYEGAAAVSSNDGLSVIRQIAKRLGSFGYAAIDTENKNQLNMENSEQIQDFCKSVEEHQDASAVFFSITETLGFLRFDLTVSEDFGGKVHVTRSVLSWIDGMPEVTDEYSYYAAAWEYTQEGYLFFEEAAPPGYDGPPGYTAVRLKPLEETCRELNRNYILPIGYGANNMFLTDWSEEDFGELDFYDLFHLLYPLVYRKDTPYGLTVDGAVYRVPEEEFGRVIMTYFNIEEDNLRSRTKYLPDEKCYEYYARGFYDYGNSPNIPYPEVVSRKENTDGTITLTVNAVWPQRHLGRAMTSETVIRPLKNGGFQYVSNRVVDWAENVEPDWYEIPNRDKMSSVISAALLPEAPSCP